MKKLIPSILLVASASTSLLLAQSEKQVAGYRLQCTGIRQTTLPSENQIRQEAETTTNYELRTANCDNSSQDLSCHLMMDPSLEEGAEALGKELGIFGKRTTPSKIAVGTTAATRFPVESGASSAMISGQRASGTTAEEISEGNATNTFLEKEICDNIYTSCLAKVAEMSLAERRTAEGMMQEKEEWEAAKDMAIEEEAELKILWERAKGETLAAQKKFDSANAILHGKAYADEAYYNWQVKELAADLRGSKFQ